MEAIKEFLKPNWWKVRILILIITLGTISFGCAVDWKPFCIIFPDFFGEISWEILFPMTSLSYFLKDTILRFYPAHWNPFFFFIISFIYWYLLACIIYFIITKIKRLMAK